MVVKSGDEKFILALREKSLKKVDLKKRLSLKESTFKAISERLRALELVQLLPNGFYKLTQGGKDWIAQYYIDLRPSFTDEKMQALIEKLPSEPHKSLFRLSLAGYVAREHLFYDFDDGWCGGIIGGKTTAFKTRLLLLLCRVLKLSPTRNYIRRLTTTLAKEILGRRESKVGGGKTIVLSPCIDLPFLGLDEYQKGDTELKRMVMFFLDGTRETTIEDRKVELRPFPLVTTNLNPKNELGIPDEVVRRTCCVNTLGLGVSPEAYEEATDLIFENPIPAIETAKLEVIFHRLEPDERKLVRRLLYDGTGKHSKDTAVFDSNTVNILVLGWLILTGGKDPKEAIFDVCFDRLTCLSSLGLTEPEWYDMWLDRYAEYKGEKDPKIEAKRIAIEKLRKQVITTIETEAEREKRELDKVFVFDTGYSKDLTDLKKIFSDLGKRCLTPIRQSMEREYKKVWAKRPWTEEKQKRLKARIKEFQVKLVNPIGVREDKERARLQAIKDEKARTAQNARERREEAIEGMKVLSEKLNQTKLMSVTKAELNRILQADQRAQIGSKHRHIRMGTGKGKCNLIIKAIQDLRASTSDLSGWLNVRIHRPARDYPLRDLENDLATAKRQANPWLTQFQKDMDWYTGKTGIKERFSGGDEKRPDESEPNRPRDDYKPRDDFGRGGIDGRDL